MDTLTCPYCGSDRVFGKACQSCPHGAPSAFEWLAERFDAIGRTPERQRPIPGDFLSIPHIAARWDCGRSTVYSRLAEMDAAGYLKRFFFDEKAQTDQRIALESIETWERLRSGAEIESRVPTAERRATKKGPRVLTTGGPSKLDDFVKNL